MRDAAPPSSCCHFSSKEIKFACKILFHHSQGTTETIKSCLCLIFFELKIRFISQSNIFRLNSLVLKTLDIFSIKYFSD